jgi:hypothetical protein
MSEAHSLGSKPTAQLTIKELMESTRPTDASSPNWKGRLYEVVRAMLFLGVYAALSCAYFVLEGWTIDEAFYFAAMTASTVGYGDLSPSRSPAASRVYTIFMILIGVVVVFPAISRPVTLIVSPYTAKGRALLERLFPAYSVDVDGDGVADYVVPRHPILYYGKNLLPSLMLNMAVQLASAGVFCAIEEWDYGSALYHCLVTVTTVGYGDQYIATAGGRYFASLHMLFGVILLAELLSSVGEVHMQRKAQLKRVAQLRRQLDTGLIGRLMTVAVELRPLVERDGKGLTELEFVISMLLELGHVEWDVVRPFIKQYRTLDVNGDGRLGMEDILLTKSLNPKALHALQLELHSSRSEKGISMVHVAPEPPPPTGT